MFGFLKDKLKGALGKLSKEVEKEAVVEKKEILVEKKPKTKTDISEKKSAETENIQSIPVEKKKGFFHRIFGGKEEEDVIEEKEELREIAESTETEDIERIIEETPKNIQETKKDKKEAEHKISEDKKVETTEEKIKEERTPIETKKPKIIPKIQEVRHESRHDTVQEAIKDKEQEHKPHHQVIEEKREHKTVEQKEEEHKGFFTKITETFTKVQISEDKFEELFWELEVVLLENNVAVEVIEKIKRDLKKELMAGKVSRKGVDELIASTLRQSIVELFDVENINLVDRIKARKQEGKPYIIAIIGVNGSGKTTSIAKLTHKFQKEGLSVVLAASDTFRAAAIQQLEEHANRLNVKMVKHDYNSDPAAVAFDAIRYAEAKKVDVVIIDTAGRLHSNTNLMRELEKVIRVCKPDIKIFVGESITGNDCVEQAKEFDKAVGIDAMILAKADVDDKGGAAISVSYILQRPILYLGTGQTYDDLKEFDPRIIIESLGL